MPAQLFDDQADHFDNRAGLPTGLAHQVATALSDLGKKHHCERILEIGPGTGELGCELMQRFPRYIAMDLSLAMLKKFDQRVVSKGHLIQADGRASWPLKDDAIDFVFGARSLHHIPPAHVLSELDRLRKNRAGILVIGQKRRDPDSAMEKLRRKLHEFLTLEGFEAREKDRWGKRLTELISEKHHVRIESVPIHRWLEKCVIEQALLQWTSKKGLAGLELSASLQSKILQDLRKWATEELGDLTLERANEVEYRLKVFSISEWVS